MPLPPHEAHLICGTLVVADVLARALRLRPILRGLGQAVPFMRVLALTLAGDAACSLTPYRAGGDAVRLAGLKRAGVPLPRAAAALVTDALLAWAVIVPGGVLVGALGGAAWWRALVAGATSNRGPWTPSPALVAAIATGAVVGAIAMRWAKGRVRLPAEANGRGPIPLSGPLLAMSLSLTVVAVACRVLVLPVLMSTAVEPFALAAAVAGSFLLLYGQLLLPLPSGIGAVDTGLLAGARPDGALTLLLLWRLYTSGLGLAPGLCALPLVLAGREPRTPPPAAAAAEAPPRRGPLPGS